MKWLATILAAISVLFNNEAPKVETPVSLNTAIIAYTDTYYAPAVADPDNFPYEKTVKFVAAEKSKKEMKPTTPILIPQPMPPAPLTLPASSTPQQSDVYLATSEPVGVNWLHLFAFPNGHSLPIKGNEDQTLSGFITDREYWKIQIDVNWVSPNPNAKLPAEKDYFKLETYEEGTNKLIYSTSSGNEEWFYKTITFRKPGKYYFKIFGHPYSSYAIDFFASSKIISQ